LSCWRRSAPFAGGDHHDGRATMDVRVAHEFTPQLYAAKKSAKQALSSRQSWLPRYSPRPSPLTS